MLFDGPKVCGWCLVQQATTMLYGTPSCFTCAAGDAKLRVSKWLRAVGKRQQESRSG